MRRYVCTISATFPELRGGVACMSAKGVGSSQRTAAAKAMNSLMTTKSQKTRTRISRATMVVSFGSVISQGEKLEEAKAKNNLDPSAV